MELGGGEDAVVGCGVLESVAEGGLESVAVAVARPADVDEASVELA